MRASGLRGAAGRGLYGLDATSGVDLAAPRAPVWTELLPRTRLQPDTVHRFLLDAAPPVTHVRIDIHPDGGIARLRLHGSLTGQGARWLATLHAELGGQVVS